MWEGHGAGPERACCQMETKDPRTEPRIPANEPVHLSDVKQPTITESTFTQNISSSGARVMTQRVWQPGTRLLVRCPRNNFWAQALVVYWRSFSSSKFTIGLKLLTQTGTWPAPKTAS